jgi:hypothetical protein
MSRNKTAIIATCTVQQKKKQNLTFEPIEAEFPDVHCWHYFAYTSRPLLSFEQVLIYRIE